MLTKLEMGAFAKLFTRGGFVLDFTTADFDAFTMDSTGIPLCAHYGLSKGNSFMEQVLRYRIVIGQPNQEELLRLLEDRVAQGVIGESQRERLYINLCPFVWHSEGKG